VRVLIKNGGSLAAGKLRDPIRQGKITKRKNKTALTLFLVSRSAVGKTHRGVLKGTNQKRGLVVKTPTKPAARNRGSPARRYRCRRKTPPRVNYTLKKGGERGSSDLMPPQGRR